MTQEGTRNARALIAVLLAAAPIARASGNQRSEITLDASVVAVDSALSADELRERIGDATVVHLAGLERRAEALPVVRRVVKLLHGALDFDVLVLPVGIFEAHRVERKLHEEIPLTNAAITLPRTWRREPTLLDLLTYARASHDTDRPLILAGHLCRFGPAAKTLYPGLLFRYVDRVGPGLLPPELRADVTRVLGTREVLSQATPARRAEARRVAAELTHAIDARAMFLRRKYSERRVALERRFVANLLQFVELEALRGEGAAPAALAARATADNLAWFTNVYFKGKKLIVWDGVGE